MDSFLKEVIVAVKNKHQNLDDLIFIVPSKRAGLFLKKELVASAPNETFFAPLIWSIEEFISIISKLRQIDGIQTLFEFYDTYLHTLTHLEKESFESFNNWAQILMQDFNEIDRYTIDHKSFFSYLSGIQDINHWYLQAKKTELIKNYISFWENLSEYYSVLAQRLLEKKIGYQGLLYRKAAEDIDHYCQNTTQKHILVGFNALNNAEQHIFQSLLAHQLADVYWDADQFFMENTYHNASLFLRNYKEKWNYYNTNPFQWIRDNFSSEKDIKLIGVPKNVGQAKLVGQILKKIPKENLQATAVVLADEALLLPMLNALPDQIGSLNITMGLPLKEVPLTSFFELLFTLQKNINTKGFYYKSILEILNSQAAFWLLNNKAHQINNEIKKQNLVYSDLKKIQHLVGDSNNLHNEIISLLFSPWKDAVSGIENCRELVILLRDSLDEGTSSLELEYVYHFHQVFNKLATLQQNYKYLTSVESLYRLYKEIIQSETLDFHGEPLKGLQLMGMLESRCLDFDTIIITGVNEGTLPAGKSANSFIPYELKIEYQLPTYKEKDAIYTNHFYRLLQRAKTVYLIYNTENDGVGGGEKSRFLRQLEIDKRPAHRLSKYIVSSEVPKLSKDTKEIAKNAIIISRLKELAAHGLSPSALTTYIRNPIDFYTSYILGARENEHVEETIAAKTLGTIIHDTLEVFYKPFEQKIMVNNDIKKMISKIDDEIKNQFRKTYADLNITYGKNLLSLEVAKRYIYNFLKSELKLLENGAVLKIIAIESTLKTSLDIPGITHPIFIKGKVDRIDELDGILRVIDYKTGKVMKSDVLITDWEVITEDYKYSKVIQVLAYAYMQAKEHDISSSFTAGIISFKNLKEGFLPFGTKDSKWGKPTYEITKEVFESYKNELGKLISEIFDINTPFIEKEV